MNRSHEYHWSTPTPPPRLAVVIPFPDRRRELGEQAVSRALNERRRSEQRERYTQAALLALMAATIVVVGALIAGVLS